MQEFACAAGPFFKMSSAFDQLDQIRKAHAKDYRVDVSFRGQFVEVMVNSVPTVSWKDGTDGNGKAKVRLLPNGSVTVTLGKDQIEFESDRPAAGELFVEGNTKKYRIQEVIERRLSWLCLCQESKIA